MDEIKRFIEFMNTASPWMAMGALTAGLLPGHAAWKEGRHHGRKGRGIRIYRGEGFHEFTMGEFRNE